MCAKVPPSCVHAEAILGLIRIDFLDGESYENSPNSVLSI